MEILAKLGAPGVMAMAHWQHSAQSVFLLVAGRQAYIFWMALVFLVCVSAAAGALANNLRAKASNRGRDSESTVGELAMLRAVIANLPDPIYVKDSECRFLLANQATAETMKVASGNCLLGKTDFDFYPADLAAGFFEDEQKVIVSGQAQLSKEETIEDASGKTRFMLSTKVPLLDAAGKSVGIIGVGRNITGLKAVEAELRRVQEELKYKATHDSLTLLLNRGAILEVLERERARSVRENSRTVVLLGDLDHFKNVNDTHGHPVGDEVLREVACRLLQAVRPYDLVGRFGGEEFLVVLPGCAAPDPLARADQLRKAVAASPILTAHGPIPTTISIGVVIAEEWDQATSEVILREVDAALYAAKAGGRNLCVFAGPPVGIREFGPGSGSMQNTTTKQQ
jgi:diguanylate cyclase (GGDEF)-like protein/PAS domain S-box-containing protein